MSFSLQAKNVSSEELSYQTRADANESVTDGNFNSRNDDSCKAINYRTSASAKRVGDSWDFHCKQRRFVRVDQLPQTWASA